MSRDHEQYEENVGAYLLGALNELESEVFERHVSTCAICRQDFEHMRVAAEALPRAVEPVEPPASLKKSLMETVTAEARERGQTAKAPSWRTRLRLHGLPRLSPGFALGLACVLAIGVAIGFGAANLGGGNGDRTVAGLVDQSRVPMGSASLVVRGDRANGALLKVQGLPQPGSNRVYEVWLHRGGAYVPAGTLFDVGKDGSGAAAIARDLHGVDAVAVTREPQGGTEQPTEQPVMSFKLA
jgi:anti-sigma-K factor RskA